MKFHVLTLFPEMIEQGIGTSITGKAMEQGTISVHAVNIRDYTEDKHKKVDDYPYGGGAGMLMQAQPVYDCFQAVKQEIQERRKRQGNGEDGKTIRVVYLTPQGDTFCQQKAEEFSREEDLVLLCGHYEGIDERVLEEIVTDYVSIGDFVLTGGELPAMVMIDAISRLVPGVLHNDLSAEVESFHKELLEFPQYSRPEVWHGKAVPEVLLSGNHKKIEEWRLQKSIERTRERRPDLYRRYERQERCIDWLMQDKLWHMDMIETLRRGQGILLYSGKDGVLLQEKRSRAFFLTAVHGEAGEKIVREHMPENAVPELFVVHQEEMLSFIEKYYGLRQANECYQAVYTRNVTLPVERSVEIRLLENNMADQVYAGYHNIGGREYVEERLKSGVMYGAFLEGELAGFIGMHDEGSMGMLYVKEEYRRRGIAAALESDAINRMLALGWLPFCQVYTENEVSLDLQRKLGLRISKNRLYWLEKVES
ncbi:MAG: tRNA (guanosine(37)-N1)-methyltransferase TrmD [Lachnospiraceae bacterium]|nr:tRNA (guanosine(37)-N1)-methyltransferase TrmD [Lachnospiraceae bacterium]